jgi:hypothetical protein
MKKLLMILLTIGLALGVSAQKVVGRGHTVVVRPHVSVGLGWGYSPFYSPWYGYGFYSPFYYPPYGYNNGYRPSRLDRQIADIKSDYADRIKSVRMQDDMTGREKRQEIRQLRQDRDQAVVQAQKDYYHKRAGTNRPYNNNGSNNNRNDNDNNDQNNNSGSE